MGGGVTDDRWRDAAIVGANRVAIFATMFSSTQSQRALLREELALVFGALMEGDSQ
jgi:hypothetical protein